jgi:hypothetical protein
MREWLREMWQHVVFRAVMLGLDVTFWKSKSVSWP